MINNLAMAVLFGVMSILPILVYKVRLMHRDQPFSDRVWGVIARFVSRPAVADWLIKRAMKRPFTHLHNMTGDLYMERWWLFNPYPKSSKDRRWWNLPISVRIHHILREDSDRALHDHPWNARTIILRGSYHEKRLADEELRAESIERIRRQRERDEAVGNWRLDDAEVYEYFWRQQGDTATLQVEEYHTIVEVSDGGVYTLFISGKWRADWGFLVKGVKVWWRTYLYGTPHPNDTLKEVAANLGNAYAELAESMPQEDKADWEQRLEDATDSDFKAEHVTVPIPAARNRLHLDGPPSFPADKIGSLLDAPSFVPGGYTGGGVPGLAPGEVPAILTNERVMSREDFERLNIGYTTPGNVTVNVTIDPAELDRPSTTIQALIDAGKRHRGEL